MNRIYVLPSHRPSIFFPIGLILGIFVVVVSIIFGNSLILKLPWVDVISSAAGVGCFMVVVMYHFSAITLSQITSSLNAEEVEYAVRGYEKYRTSHKRVPVAQRAPPAPPKTPPRPVAPVQAPTQVPMAPVAPVAPVAPPAAPVADPRVLKELQEREAEQERMVQLWGTSNV